MQCYCDKNARFEQCCEPYLLGTDVAPDAATLMRSRYSAFATGNVTYITKTWHPKHVPKPITLDDNQKWIGLKVLEHISEPDRAWVKFVARYKIDGKAHRLEEHSLFNLIDGRWYYLHALET